MLHSLPCSSRLARGVGSSPDIRDDILSGAPYRCVFVPAFFTTKLRRHEAATIADDRDRKERDKVLRMFLYHPTCLTLDNIP